MSTRSPAKRSADSEPLDARFKNAYWCDHKIQIRVSGPDGDEVIRLGKPFARIGSHPSSDVVLPHGSIDRRHLYLHATPEGVFCLVFRRRKFTGRRVDSKPDKPLPLKLGRYKLLVQLDREAESSGPRNRDWSAQVPSSWERTPILTIKSAGRPLGQYPIRRRLISIGSHPTNGICISSRSVSPFHAVVYWENDKLWVIDLFSSATTQLDGAEIEAAEFDVNAVLEIGRIKISQSWTVDWKQIVEDHKSLWLPRSDRTRNRSVKGSAAHKSNLTAGPQSSDGFVDDPLLAPESAESAELVVQSQSEKAAETIATEPHLAFSGDENLISLDIDGWNESELAELAETIPPAYSEAAPPRVHLPDENQQIEFAEKPTDPVDIQLPDNQSIKNLQRDCFKARARLEKTVAVRKKVNLEIQRLAKRKEAQASSLDKLNEELDVVSRQVADAQAQLIALQIDADRERQECARLRHDFDSSQTDANKQLAAERSELQRNEREIEQKRRELASQQTQWEADRSGIEQRLDDLHAALELRAAKIAEEESQLTRSQQQLVDDRTNWFHATEQNQDDCRRQQEQLNQKFDDLANREAELEAQCQVLRQAQQTIEHAQMDATAVSRLQSELNELRSTNEQLKTMRSQAEIERLQQLDTRLRQLAKHEADLRVTQSTELQQAADRRAESDRLTAEAAQGFAALKIEREKLQQAQAENQDVERLQQEQLRQKSNELANREAELESQRQILELGRQSLERMMSAELVQQSVLANMQRLQRENSFVNRLLQRLWPFT